MECLVIFKDNVVLSNKMKQIIYRSGGVKISDHVYQASGVSSAVNLYKELRLAKSDLTGLCVMEAGDINNVASFGMHNEFQQNYGEPI